MCKDKKVGILKEKKMSIIVENAKDLLNETRSSVKENLFMKDSIIILSEKLTPYIYSMKDGNTVEDKVNIFLIMGMFASKTITLEKAAELADKTIWEFIDILKKYDIPWGEITEEGAEMDDIAIAKLSEGV